MRRKMIGSDPSKKDAAQRQTKASTFADDAEMSEILSRPELVKRLKAGSRDARRRKGRFVADTLGPRM